MPLNKREKTLALVTGVLAALVGCWFVFSALSGPLTARRAQRDSLQRETDQKKRRAQAAWKAQQQLAEYRRRSLPADVEIARSLYRNWLLELATRTGLDDTRVQPQESRGGSDVYRVLPFSVNGRATLNELTEFLFDFYSQGYLHKIRQLSIKHLEGQRDLDLRITIEALSMPDADRQDKLSEEPSVWLADASLADYQNSIGRRNLFAPYEPPPPPRSYEPAARSYEPPTPPPFDPSKYAFVTGIVEVDGQPQLWLKARTTGQVLTLAEGDTFEIGPAQGTVVQIHQRAAEIRINGEHRLIPLGNSLHNPAKTPK